jgi:2-C-methyl-D-erythritol 4-phosphate cytidylyltransferase
MENTDRRYWCVVPAAGRGARFGGEVPKQYHPFAGKPVLMHSLERLAMHARVAGIVVVLAADDLHWGGIDSLCGKPVLAAAGGAERADSVLAGLNAVPAHVPQDEFVLVHDAARPCVRAEDISRLIELGVPAGGALLAAPLRDTLKRADNSRHALATEPRDSRWRALTPQLFRRGELAAALEAARVAGIAVTDESMAMERIGHRPLLVAGAEDNIKITTPHDLALAEYLLGRIG